MGASGAPGEGRQGRSPRASAGVGAAAAAAAGSHTGSAVPGCGSCCHDDDVTDATTGGGGACVAQGGLRAAGGGDAAGKGGRGRGARAGHPGRGVFSPPSPARRARGEGGGGAGDRWLGQWARPPGRGAGGRRSADVMDGLGGAGRRAGGAGDARVAVRASRRAGPPLRCSRSPARPPFHNPQRRRGVYRGDGCFSSSFFLQGKGSRPREDGAGAQVPCRRGVAGGRAGAGPAEGTRRPRARPGGGARRGGARTGPPRLIKGPPRRRSPCAPRAPRPSLPARQPPLMSSLHARFRAALSGLGTPSARMSLHGCAPPPPCVFPSPPRRRHSHLGPVGWVPGARAYL